MGMITCTLSPKEANLYRLSLCVAKQMNLPNKYKKWPGSGKLRNAIENYAERHNKLKANTPIQMPDNIYAYGLEFVGNTRTISKTPIPRKKTAPTKKLRVRRNPSINIKVNEIKPFFKKDEVIRKLPEIAKELNSHLQIYGLNSRLKKTHFIAQIASESSTGLREEAKARSLSRAIELWGRRANTLELKKYTYVTKSGKNYYKADGTLLTIEDRINLLNYVYGKNLINLGNIYWSDGYKFRGGGLIHLTGRANYNDFTVWNKSVFGESVDFTQHPELITSGKYAARSAAYFWVRHHLDQIAEQGVADKIVNKITKIVNPNMNGASTRRINFHKYWRKK